MSDKPISGQDSHEATQDGTGARGEEARPWVRRPLFWALLLALCLLLLFAWLFWKKWQEARHADAEMAAQAAELRQRNENLEGFLLQLRALLAKEPCDIQKELQRVVPPAGVAWPPIAAPAPSVAAGGAHAAAPAKEGGRPATPRPVDFAALMEQATVLVLALREEGLSMGSGFFVAPGCVVTNAHVVGTAAKAVVVNKATGAPLSAVVTQSTQSGGRDFAILAVQNASHITPLPLATAVSRTERVSAWGFPGAVTNDDPKFAALLKGNAAAAPEVVYTDGVVSVVLERVPPLIVHTATVSQGNSGGPLVNDKGEVVGINTFIKLDDESYRQSSLAIVSASLAEYLKVAGIPFTLAPTVDAGTRQGGRP